MHLLAIVVQIIEPFTPECQYKHFRYRLRLQMQSTQVIGGDCIHLLYFSLNIGVGEGMY